MRILIFLLLSILIVSGCAGFRGGTFSVPYVGEHEPGTKAPSTPYERGQLQKLQLPGLNIEISLNNLKRTYDYTVVLFVVPTSVKLGDYPQNATERPLEVELKITPTVRGFEFDPRNAIVNIDEKSFKPRTAAAAVQTQLPLALEIGKNYSFKILYEAPTPPPESRISLDLSKALINAELPTIPVIKFRKLDWSAGYT